MSVSRTTSLVLTVLVLLVLVLVLLLLLVVLMPRRRLFYKNEATYTVFVKVL